MAEPLSSDLSASTNSIEIHLASSRPVTLLPLLSSSSAQTNPPKTLETILNSPRFPDQHHEPVWRVLDATEKVKRLLKAGCGGHVGGAGGLGKGKLELKAVWVQLEVIGDVVRYPFPSLKCGCGIVRLRCTGELMRVGVS